MKVIVVGATGTIGKAVVELLESQGHEVVGLSRKSSPSLDMRNADEVDAFYREAGEVDAIVIAAGDAAFTGLDELTEEGINLSLTSKLMGQINMARKGLANLKPGGVIVITGGFLAYKPAPQTAMIAMVNSGLEGFVKAAALEMTEGRRIAIVHPPWVRETAEALGMDAAPWPPAAKVAEAYLTALQGTQNGTPVFVEGYDPRKD